MNEEQFIIKVFKSHGYTAKKILETDTKTPDFIVSCHSDEFKYLVELKSKYDDEAQLAKKKNDLNKGKIFLEADSIQRKNRISGIVKSATEQLEALKIDPDFKLVWLLALGENPKKQILQFQSSLYGSMNIIVPSEGGYKQCYFFENSDFYNHRNTIDGAIISTTESLKLCLNTYSEKYLKIKNSALAKVFESGLVDPNEMEKQNKIFIADCNIDRKNESEVTAFIINKYGISGLDPIRLGYSKITVLN